MSDPVNNTIRGVLAEYIVAVLCVGASTAKARDAWAAFDLETPDGIKIEIKSSSYVQRWAQSHLSPTSFDISPSHAWNPESGDFDHASKCQAGVCVFVLLAHQDKSTIDTMNLDQWEFYVLSAEKLDTNFERQKTITIRVGLKDQLHRLILGNLNLLYLRQCESKAAPCSKPAPRHYHEFRHSAPN